MLQDSHSQQSVTAVVFLNNSHALASAGAADGYVLRGSNSAPLEQILVAKVSGPILDQVMNRKKHAMLRRAS